MGIRTVEVTTDMLKNMGPYRQVLSNTIHRVHGNCATNLSKTAVDLVSELDRIWGRRPGAEKTVEDLLDGIKELSAWQNACLHLEQAMQFLTEAESHGEPWECTPSLLSQTFLGWVVADLEFLKQVVAKLLVRPLDFNQQALLFRQLCLVYDALWYKILIPDRIIKTNRVPVGSIENYRELVRQKSMELIATSEYLPEQWRDWDADLHSPDLRIDFEFYMQGVVPPAHATEFNMILSFTRAKENGPVFEMLAWLHMRTREITGLLDKANLLGHTLLWRSQADFACELIKTCMSRIVPIPE